MASAEDFIKRLEMLQSYKSNFDTLFQAAKEVVLPDASDFNEKRAPGEVTTRKLYNMTAVAANEKFASAMESFLVPRHMKWHGLRPSDPGLMKDKDVREFFDNLTEMLFKIRLSTRARFYGQMHENLKSLGAYGNGCLFVGEHDSGRGVRYRYTPVSMAWISENHLGIVDTIYHKYRLTAKAAAQKWPDSVPEKAALAIERGMPFEEHEYLHVVQPNDPTRVDPESAEPTTLPFQAYDICVDSKEIIRHASGSEYSGYYEFPYLWSRYTVHPHEVYGRGPGTLVLPDIQTLQEMEKVFLRSGHKVADPPLLVAADGRLGRGKSRVSLRPGEMTRGGVDESGRAKIIPLQTNARLDLTEAMIERKVKTINEFFLVNLFDVLTQDRVEMTATEVLERAKEKGQLVTPVVGRQQSELLGPMIEREIGILQRQGLLPPIPSALEEAKGNYEIEYDSLATRMQQADEVAAFQRLTEIFAPYSQIDPSIQQVVRAEDAARAFGEDMGIRVSLFRTEREMKELRAEQAKAAQEQQALDAAPGLARGAKDLSQAEIG